MKHYRTNLARKLTLLLVTIFFGLSLVSCRTTPPTSGPVSTPIATEAEAIEEDAGEIEEVSEDPVVVGIAQRIAIRASRIFDYAHQVERIETQLAELEDGHRQAIREKMVWFAGAGVLWLALSVALGFLGSPKMGLASGAGALTMVVSAILFSEHLVTIGYVALAAVVMLIGFLVWQVVKYRKYLMQTVLGIENAKHGRSYDMTDELAKAQDEDTKREIKRQREKLKGGK